MHEKSIVRYAHERHMDLKDSRIVMWQMTLDLENHMIHIDITQCIQIVFLHIHRWLSEEPPGGMLRWWPLSTSIPLNIVLPWSTLYLHCFDSKALTHFQRILAVKTTQFNNHPTPCRWKWAISFPTWVLALTKAADRENACHYFPVSIYIQCKSVQGSHRTDLTHLNLLIKCHAGRAL